MGQLEKMSTLVYKQCPRCGLKKERGEFNKTRARYDGLDWECRECHKLRMKIWNATEQARISKLVWQKTPRGKLLNRRRVDRYQATERGALIKRLNRRKAYDRNKQREMEHKRLWLNKHPDYYRERYHKLQNEILGETGIFCKPEDFYPAYRFLKALENAEVVEIKV